MFNLKFYIYMKKFTFILLAIICSYALSAQKQAFSVKAGDINSNADKSSWITHYVDNGNGYIGIGLWDDNEQIGTRFPVTSLSSFGNNTRLTKVKLGFYGYDYTDGGTTTPYRNKTATIHVWQGGSYDATTQVYTPGTEKYTQQVTATTDGFTEFALTTPVTINKTEELFVYLTFPTGAHTGTIISKEPVPAADGLGNIYYDTNTPGWGPVSFTGGAVKPFAIELFIEDDQAYQPVSDLTAGFLRDSVAPYATATPITIQTTDSLKIYPYIQNNGPDPTSNNATIIVKLGDTEVYNRVLTLSEASALAVNYFTFVSLPAYLGFSAADLNGMNLNGNFNATVTVTYAGTDNNAANNTATLAITRGTVTLANCDVETLYLTSNTDPTPMPSPQNLTATQSLTLYPAFKNNGPEAVAAGSTISLVASINGQNQPAQTITAPASGFPVDAVIALSENGQTFTAAQMTAAGLTGTFEICLTLTYGGDQNAANNKKCITIVRAPSNIENTISNSISVYPNPANDFITISNVKGMDIVIVDVLGKQVANINNASENQTIDTQNLSNGIYFVKVNGSSYKINVLR